MESRKIVRRNGTNDQERAKQSSRQERHLCTAVDEAMRNLVLRKRDWFLFCMTK